MDAQEGGGPWSGDGTVESAGDPPPHQSVKRSQTQLRNRRWRLTHRPLSTPVDGGSISPLPEESSPAADASTSALPPPPLPEVYGSLPNSPGRAAHSDRVVLEDADPPTPFGDARNFTTTSTQRHNRFRRLRWASRRDASTAASFLRDLPPA